MTVAQRVPPLPPEERSERQADLVRQAGAELGVYTTLVRHTELFADFLVFGRRMLRLGTLIPRDRELLILRTAWRCGAPYEWSHHEVIGRRVGLTEDDLALLQSEVPGGADAATTLLLGAADELLSAHVLSDRTWTDLLARYSAEEIMEICMLVGEYAMLAGTLNSLGVRIEEGYPTPGWFRA